MSYHFPLTLLALCALFITSAATRAESLDIRVHSGPAKVAVLELYTSEGCSSCPPADRFVRNLGRTGWYPRQLIPLSFHVTYWDYIGWRDDYAQAAFDQRQRAIAARLHSATVYTPQLVLDGQDARGGGRFGHKVNALNALAPGAKISLRAYAESLPDVQLDVAVEFMDSALKKDAEVFVALFENNLVSHVDAGENRGKQLEHDYVVRRLIGPLTPNGEQLHSRHTLTLQIEPPVKLEDAGVAVLVQNSEDGSVLQAVATPLVAP